MEKRKEKNNKSLQETLNYNDTRLHATEAAAAAKAEKRSFRVSLSCQLQN